MQRNVQRLAGGLARAAEAPPPAQYVGEIVERSRMPWMFVKQRHVGRLGSDQIAGETQRMGKTEACSGIVRPAR